MSIYTEKNKRRKAGRTKAYIDGYRGYQVREARAQRRLRDGAFGNVTAFMWNTLVVGTMGDERDDKGEKADPKIPVVVA